MAIKTIGFGYEVTGYDPIDVRQILTKDQMKTIIGDDPSEAGTGDYAMPEIYFAFCVDDGCFYKFDYEATPNPETGKFTKLELGGSTPSADSGPVADRPDAEDSSAGDTWYDPTTGETYQVVINSEGNKEWVEKAPAAGEMMYDATAGKILYFDGTEWREVGGNDVVPSGSTAPVSPQVGDHWLDTSVTPPVEKIWDGTQWVEIPPKTGAMMYDETAGKILYFDGNTWREVGGVDAAATGDTPPSPAHVGDRWLDTTQTPPVLKEYDGVSWSPVSANKGDMMYDDDKDVIKYYDGTEWKEMGGGIEHESSVSPSSTGEPGDIIYDETAGQYKTYEPAKSGDTSGVWVTMAKVWEGTTAQFNALDSNGVGTAWSTRHPDVIIFIKD